MRPVAEERPADPDAPTDPAPEAEEEGERPAPPWHPVLRARLATAVWLAAAACSMVLAVGALLAALRVGGGHVVVDAVRGAARTLDLGTLTSYAGEDALVRERLTSWGAAAVVYLVVGAVLDRLVRPRPTWSGGRSV